MIWLMKSEPEYKYTQSMPSEKHHDPKGLSPAISGNGLCCVSPKGQGVGRRQPPTPWAGLEEECATTRPVSFGYPPSAVRQIVFVRTSRTIVSSTISKPARPAIPDQPSFSSHHDFLDIFDRNEPGRRLTEATPAPRIGPSEGAARPDIDSSILLE
jgi:hypothetical protein